MKGTALDYFVLFSYLVLVTLFGMLFSRFAQTTRDFYLGGQRFRWWLIAFSCISTTVGSYSFVKYSEAGFLYGLSSTQSYLNDWFWVGITLFAWLPILYFNRILSVPEYFERRFGRSARNAASFIILLYLVGYVGINLLTLGKALQALSGLPVFWGATLACVAVTAYAFTGGQSAVIMTDFIQGLTLLIAGLGIFVAGIRHVGGVSAFWESLPLSHRFIFSEFDRPAEFSFLGIFAQDGLANTGAFFLMNQGMIMRFLALRTPKEAPAMMAFWVLVLYPLAAIAVSGGGWVARVLVERGEIQTQASSAFVDVAHFLCYPGFFGFVLAALMAALISTADTLINAASAIFVNDFYRVYVRPSGEDAHYLRIARVSSLCVAGIGLLLVPVLFRNPSVYHAHALFTAIVTPPLVVAVFLALFWRRYNTTAVLATLLGGGILIGLSLVPSVEALVMPWFSFGMGAESFLFMRALFGLCASAVLGTVVTLLTSAPPSSSTRGLVVGEQLTAMRLFKGAEPNFRKGHTFLGTCRTDPALKEGEALMTAAALQVLNAHVGDFVLVSDARWLRGNLRVAHVRVVGTSEGDAVRLSEADALNANLPLPCSVRVEKFI